MTSITQGYSSPNLYSATDMFARNATGNDSVKIFGKTPTNNRPIEPRESENYAFSRGTNLHSINTDESSYFDFDPPSRAESPYQNQFSTSGASGMPWNNETNFRPFTPPSSASFSPKSWPYTGFQQVDPSNVFTNTQPFSTRAQHGQVTPPDYENDNESLLGHQLREQLELRELQPPQPEQPPQSPQETGKGKRKRNSKTSDSASQSPPKRTRKYASRGLNNANASNKPEDAKRSKFLERNRVAASKCRQKKKEWTQNLENRARELQKNNNQLRVVVESCRQEVLFLKGELLKHSQCDCESIQAFLKSGAESFVDHTLEEDLFSHMLSPIESRPISRLGSTDAESGQNNPASTASSAEPSSASVTKDDHALEALLTSSLKHDTSDEGIASQVAGVAAA